MRATDKDGIRVDGPDKDGVYKAHASGHRESRLREMMDLINDRMDSDISTICNCARCTDIRNGVSR